MARHKSDLVVHALSRRATAGVLRIGSVAMPCALGRGGRTYRKREGDGATPIGRWRVVNILYRRDRIRGIAPSGLRGRATQIMRGDGWCDATSDRNYNRHVRHPYPASAEPLWRDDQLYDVIIVLDHNQRPRVRGLGSAIFMHVAKPTDQGLLTPTAGCVALRRRDLALVLRWLQPGDFIRVLP